MIFVFFRKDTFSDSKHCPKVTLCKPIDQKLFIRVDGNLMSHVSLFSIVFPSVKKTAQKSSKNRKIYRK